MLACTALHEKGAGLLHKPPRGGMAVIGIIQINALGEISDPAFSNSRSPNLVLRNILWLSLQRTCSHCHYLEKCLRNATENVCKTVSLHLTADSDGGTQTPTHSQENTATDKRITAFNRIHNYL